MDKAMEMKAAYLAGEDIRKEVFRNKFMETEKWFDSSEPVSMDERSREFVERQFNFGIWFETKRNNWMLLNELLNKDGQISDKDMQKILDEAHVLPYGDVLVDFLMAFLQMFKAHTHKYPNDRPCPDDYSKAMDEKYGRCGRKVEKDDNLESISGGTPIEMVNSTFRGLYDKLLSKNVRIN